MVAYGSSHVSIRSAEAFPLSEFRLKDDLAVFNLPDEALLNFEGSGVETFWELELPAIANPHGLGHLADVLITFDLRARYSPELHQQHLASLPTTVRRFVLVSAKAYAAAGLAELQGEATSATVAFDLAAVGLPAQETSRKLKNLVLILIAPGSLDFVAVFGSSSPMLDVTVAFEQGVAFSNAPPIADDQSSAPPSPLNAFVDVEVAQTFNLAVLKTGSPGIDFSTVADVILGIDYEADLS